MLKDRLYDALCRIDKVRGDRAVTLVAATKTVPAEIVSDIVALGVKDAGENRVQEYLQKRDFVTGADWHFIGTLQRNKAKYLVGNVKLIQSVSSVALASEIDRLAKVRGVVQPVLIELNAGGENTKTGAAESEVAGLIEYARTLSNVKVKGLMSLVPKAAGDAPYALSRRVYERYHAIDPDFDIFSMGMSGDYEKAIEYGSNMVRLGSALFGQRK